VEKPAKSGGYIKDVLRRDVPALGIFDSVLLHKKDRTSQRFADSEWGAALPGAGRLKCDAHQGL